MDQERYIKLCKRLDEILIKTGIRKKCIDCSIKTGGCCKGCSHRREHGGNFIVNMLIIVPIAIVFGFFCGFIYSCIWE